MKMCKSKSSETRNRGSQVNNVQGNCENAFHVSSDKSSTICVNIGGVKLEMFVNFWRHDQHHK